jgi:hypothetical protein
VPINLTRVVLAARTIASILSTIDSGGKLQNVEIDLGVRLGDVDVRAGLCRKVWNMHPAGTIRSGFIFRPSST